MRGHFPAEINGLLLYCYNIHVKIDFTDCVNLHPSNTHLPVGMQSISYWMEENRLNLNTCKTKIMLVGSIVRLAEVGKIGLSLNGEAIDEVDTFKYL